MNSRTALLLLWMGVLFGGALPLHSQTVLISEFMADNGGDPDWIELYNAGTNFVNLGGWGLTDDPADLAKWTLPYWVTLGAHEFKLVFASGEDVRKPGKPLQTSFRLGKSGYLALVGPDGETIMTEFSPQYPFQTFNISYGFAMAGLAVQRGPAMFLSQTPLGPNPGTSAYGELPLLTLTELMYQPVAPPSNSPYRAYDFQFIELKNSGSNALDLGGYRFLVGPSLLGTFRTNLILAAGQRVLLVANREAFISRYGTSPLIGGTFPAGLTNDLRRIRLWTSNGLSVFDFAYVKSWHPLTDGAGFSLVLRNEVATPGSYDEAATWRSSSQWGGSPGQADPPPPPIPPIVVNEVLSRSVSPLEDAIELFNPGDEEVELSGWWLTDDRETPRKFRIPEGTFISSHGFLAFDEHTFNWDTSADDVRFSFNTGGEAVYLFSANADGSLTGYAHGFEFGGAETNVSFGRHVTSTGEEHFVAQSTLTFGEPNNTPKVGPVILSEIHYQPVRGLRLGQPEIDSSDQEYIELHNITGDPVPLYDATSPTNTWELRGAVQYKFPTDTVIPPYGHILVVPRNWAEPIGSSDLPVPDMAIYGPWQGKLNNSGATIELVRFESVPLVEDLAIVVDKVSYSSSPPWPVGANGMGPSLQRIDSHAYGNDPANWHVAVASPGFTPTNGMPPVAVFDSQDTLVVEGSPINYAVTATGDAPLRYQWLFGERPILGEVNSTLTLVALRSGESGRYSCYVSNPYGVVRTASARLTVTSQTLGLDSSYPTLSVTSPAAPFVSVSTNRLTIAGTASDDQDVAGVFIRHNDGPPVRASGDVAWSASAELVPGSNTFQITAVDWAGNLSVTSSITVHWSGGPLGLAVHGAGAVNGLTNGQLLTFGRRYTLKAVPASGNVFSNWTDRLGGVLSTQQKLSFVASPHAALIANFVPNPFPSLRGTYAGLFYRPAEPAHDSSGYFTFTLGRRGGYSGWLRHGGKRYPMQGQFDLALSAHREILRQGTNALAVTLQLAAEADDVTGSVSNAVFVSELSGKPVLFGRTKPATGLAGTYSLSFGEGVHPGAADARYGHGRLIVRPGGRAEVRVRLSDGARIARDFYVTGEGWLPLQAPLYRERGSLFGWLTLTNTANDPFLGSLLWTRKTLADGSPPPIAFTNRVEAQAIRLLPTAAGAAE